MDSQPAISLTEGIDHVATTGLEGLVRLHPRARERHQTSRKTGVVVLLRVSSQRQLNTAADVDADGNSIATQRQWAERKTRDLGGTIIKEFVEPGHSAQAIAKRPIFRQMLDFVRENADAIGYVVIYSRSRAFRSIYDANDVEKEFQSLRIELVSATEDFGNDPDQAALMKQVTDGMNHYQVRVNGRDVSKKMLHKVENGGSVGRAKLGYLNDRKEIDGRLITTISVDPARAELVRWAFETYATGDYSIKELRELVAAQGLTTRPTRRWKEQAISLSQLANMLRDPYYAGVVRYLGNLYPGRHEPLISKELFLRVQRILNERAQRGQRDVYHHHWAKGLIWCDRCRAAGRESRLILTEAKGNGGSYMYYICRGRQQGFCNLPSIPVSQVEEGLGRQFGSLAIRREYVESIRSEVEAALESAQGLEQEMRANIRSKLRQLDIREERLLDLAADVDVATLRLGARLKSIQMERGELEERLGATTLQIQRGASALFAYLALLTTPGTLFRQANDSARRSLLQAFFSQIWLDLDCPPKVDSREPLQEVLGAARVLQHGVDPGPLASEPERKRDDAMGAVSRDASVGLLGRFFLDHGLSRPTLAGVPGLEPRTTEPESAVLPITPYPIEKSLIRGLFRNQRRRRTAR